MARQKFKCLDCNIDTGRIGEHYMLYDDIWLSVVESKNGMLCIGCLEKRLNRRLKSEDFINCYVNTIGPGRIHSARLSNRLSKNIEIMTAVALTNPKYPHNVGAAIRACSCWDIPKLIWSGTRVPHPDEWKDDEELSQYRMPREERMKGYKNVELTRSNRFKDIIKEGYTPVAVEIMEESENLFQFEHPENAIYIFGPEDGSLDSRILQHCHRFVTIPTKHCLNLSCAINVVLGHRSSQIYNKTGELLTLSEDRGFIL